MHLFNGLSVIATFCALLLLSGCSGGGGGDDDGGGGDTNSALSFDTDGDGLTDAEETVLGTAIRIKDTDGDGYDDFEEVVNRGFNSANNNFRFNPLIADLPKMRVEITSVPDVSLKVTSSEGVTAAKEVTRSTESANSISTSDTSSNSNSVEQTHSVGVEVGYEAGPTGGFSGSVSYDYSHATTNESAFSNTNEQITENRTLLSNTEAETESTENTISGGELAVSVTIKNDSDVAFVMKNLLLGAVQVDSVNPGNLVPVGNLNLDTTFSSFSNIPLGPNESAPNLTFNNNDLTSDTAISLLRDATGLIVNVATAEVVDANGTAFVFTEAEVRQKTATVIIDYGLVRASERYLVATNVNAQTARVSVRDALTDILKIPYTLDSSGSLDAVRDVAAATITNSSWVIVHVTDDGVTRSVTTFDPEAAAYDLEALELKSGDVLQLTYLEDADHDGAGMRAEFMAGTDPNVPDTDGDGLLDGEEINGYSLTMVASEGFETIDGVTSNPNRHDTDNDGLSDFEEFDPSLKHWKSNPNRADTDSDKLLDIYDPMPATASVLDTDVTAQLNMLADSATISVSFTPPAIPGVSEARWDFFHIRYDLLGESSVDGGYLPGGKIYDPESPTPEALNFGFFSHDQTIKLRFQLEVNGSGSLIVWEREFSTAVTRDRLKVALKTLSVGERFDSYEGNNTDFPCIDDATVSPDDTECEFFWRISVGGEVVSSLSKLNAIKLQTSDPDNRIYQFTSNDTLEFEMPDAPGACFDMVIDIWEKEGFAADIQPEDDQLSPLFFGATLPVLPKKSMNARHCRDDVPSWGHNDPNNSQDDHEIRGAHQTLAASGSTIVAEEVFSVMLEYTVQDLP